MMFSIACSIDLKGFLAGLFFYDVKCVVYDLLSYALLAVKHDAVDKFGNEFRVVYGIRKYLSVGYVTSSRHLTSLLH